MDKLLKLYSKWCSISDKIRFLLVGGFNAAFSYVIFAIAIYLIGSEHYQICVALQWIISSVFSFVNQKIFVFCTKGHWIKEYLKCCTSWVIAYLINAILLEFFVRQIKLSPYLAQILAPAIAGIFTFFVFKIIVFNKKTNY